MMMVPFLPSPLPRTIVLCFLGLDGAGKTTIVKALQGEDFGTVHPTMGFSRAEFSVKKCKVVAYDLGGSQKIREIWSTYFAEVYGLVYVIDASAASRLQENKSAVDTLTEVPELQGKPILFLLNKKDLPEALDEMQFSDRFNLHNMAKRNKTDIRVEGVCAVKGTGKEIDLVIVEGMEWLIQKVLDNYEKISKGVEQALKKLRERQAQERLERQHRLAMAANKESPPEAGSPVAENSNSRTGEEDENAATGIAKNDDIAAPSSTTNVISDGIKNEEIEASKSRGGRMEDEKEGDQNQEISTQQKELRSNDKKQSNKQTDGPDYGIFEITRNDDDDVRNNKEVSDEIEMVERRHGNG